MDKPYPELTLIIVLILLSCKEKSSNIVTGGADNTSEGSSNILEASNEISELDKENVEKKESKYFNEPFNKLQGIWVGEKDINQSISYRVQYNKKILDIICVEGICGEGQNDNSIIEIGYLGFSSLDKKDILEQENTFELEDLKSDGDILIKLGKEVLIDEIYDINDAFYTTTLVSSYMKEEQVKLSSFVKINSLPIDIFRKIKDKDKENNTSFVKTFNIEGFSKKVRVTVEKTFFYNEMSEDSQRQAFLVKDDIAYLEDIHDAWVKVYYDGKIVSVGYIKKEDIEILK